MRRREFLQNALLSAGATVLSGLPTFAAAAPESRIDILLAESVGTISPNIYGHFAENLGGVIYDGIWVGEQSKIRNINGIRAELVEHMKTIRPGVVRFPGGCFADSYDWRDGIGPKERRPRRTNFWLGEERANDPAIRKYDPNQFGTNEFIQFCRLVNAQPYLAANLRSLPAEAFYRWVEYCNSPAGSTTLAEQRAAEGFKDPFEVRFWGVGNEAWGCGGNFTAQEYAAEFCRFAAWVPDYTRDLALIASGPSDDDYGWTQEFFQAIGKKGLAGRVYAWALHHYSWNLSRGKNNDWNSGKGDAVNFDPVDWYELLREGGRIEEMITGHWQVMGETDKEHKVKLAVDEWGPWYKPGSGLPDHILEQMPTVRDAVFSAMTLDIFNRHANKVVMANCAQLINCLNSLYLASEDNFVVTPVGHVFGMYAGHQGGASVRTEFSAPWFTYDRDTEKTSFWRLKGSASLKEKTLFLTVVNAHVSESQEAEIVIHGASATDGTMTTLTGPDIHAHNTFQQRDVVAPREAPLKAGNPLVVTFPPASVTSIAMRLG